MSEWEDRFAKADKGKKPPCVRFMVEIVVPQRSISSLSDDPLHELREYGSAEITQCNLVPHGDPDWME